MRTWLCVAVILCSVAGAAPAQERAKSEKDQRGHSATRTILAHLQAEVDSRRFDDPGTLAEFLADLRKLLEEMKKPVSFTIDEEAFREERFADAPDIMKEKLQFRNLPPKVSVHALLQQSLKQLHPRSALLIRAGKVEIVPYARTSKQHMLNQTFHAEFAERRLDQALDELSDLTGVSIVLDARARQKAQATITARFRDDVALQDAVRMLADMAELKIVHLVTGVYVTTQEHAQMMQKELRRAYGEPDVVPGAELPWTAPIPIDLSPLMPPLPPPRGGREP